MDREELIQEAQRLVTAHWEMRVAVERTLSARKREQEALEGMQLCKREFIAVMGLSFLELVDALRIAEAMLLVAGEMSLKPSEKEVRDEAP